LRGAFTLGGLRRSMSASHSATISTAPAFSAFLRRLFTSSSDRAAIFSAVQTYLALMGKILI
jgi:hypothetical protein